MNTATTEWLPCVLADTELDDDAHKVAEALTAYVTGLAPVARTDFHRISKRTGLDRFKVLDCLEDLIESKHIEGWKVHHGFTLRLPETETMEIYE